VAGVCERCKGRLSLRVFMGVVGQPYWRLRDDLRSAPGRLKRPEALAVDRKRVKAVALSHPTSGYRPGYQVLRTQGKALGRARVRDVWKDVGLQPRRPQKTRRPPPQVTESADFPQGRRVQIEATRLTLEDGVAWISLVEDGGRGCV
jgi:hypothetical protein